MYTFWGGLVFRHAGHDGVGGHHANENVNVMRQTTRLIRDYERNWQDQQYFPPLLPLPLLNHAQISPARLQFEQGNPR